MRNFLSQHLTKPLLVCVCNLIKSLQAFFFPSFSAGNQKAPIGALTCDGRSTGPESILER